MKTIIVPTDFSNESLAGLDLALMIAIKMGAEIKLIHVISKNNKTDTEYLKQECKLANMKFENLLQTNKKNSNSSIDIAHTTKEGKIFEEITNFADTFEDTLIVLSTHNTSGFEDLFNDGNAYKITSHSKVPVITIRSSKKVTDIKKIVLPLDITFQTREKVPLTVMLAKIFKAEIYLISVRLSNIESIEEKLQQYIDQVAFYINNQNIPLTIKHLKGDNLTNITLDYARSVNADLISIMTDQEKSISNILLGSYAHQMITKAFIPVLSFPNYQLRIPTEDIWDLGAFNARN